MAGNKFEEIENVFTFETGPGVGTLKRVFNSTEGTAQANATLVTSPAPPHTEETYCLRCLATATGKNTWTSPPMEAFGGMTMEFYVRFNNMPTGGDNQFTFLEVTSGGSTDFKLDMESITTVPDPPGGATASKFHFIDNAGTSTFVDYNLFPDDTWVRIGLDWEQGSSKTMKIYKNGSLIKIITSADLIGGGGDITVILKGQLLGGAATSNVFFKTLYVMSTGGVLLGATIVKAYRIGKDSVTPDADLNGSEGSGEDLDTGNWKNISSGTTVATAGYDSTQGQSGVVICDDSDNNGVPGPLDDMYRKQTIYGAKWCSRLSGDTTSCAQLLYGRKRADGKYFLETYPVQGAKLHAASAFKEWGTSETVPNGDDEMAIGLYRNFAVGGSGALVEGWCILWYDSPTLATRTTTVHVKGGDIKGGDII